MNMDIKKFLGFLVFSLFLSFSYASPVLAGNDSPSPPHKSYPNLAWEVSERKTAIVYVFNATPYAMALKNNPFTDSNYSESPQTYDATPIVYSPSGLPRTIPPKYAAPFVISWMDTGDSADKVNKEAVITYNMQNVDSTKMYTPAACTVNPQVGQADILLEFDRVKPNSTGMASAVGKLILSSVASLTDLVGFVTEGNPIAFAGFFVAACELPEEIKDINELNDKDADQLYFSAFVVGSKDTVPTNSNPDTITQIPQISYLDATPSTVDDPSSDGVATQHAAGHGCPQSDIVVTTALLRDKKASEGNFDGVLPVVLVVVAENNDWQKAISPTTNVTMQASPAGYKISQRLKRESKAGMKAYWILLRSLAKDDSRLFIDAYTAIRAHKTLTHDQEDCLARVASALEKHTTTVQPASTPVKSPVHNTTLPKNKLERK